MDLKALEDKMIDEILSMDERTHLKEIEEAFLKDPSAKALISHYQAAMDDYNFYLKHYGETHELTKKYQRLLYEAKLALDNNPLVKEYNDTLIKVNEPLHYLENNLLSLFSRSKGGCKC